jgi:hypothetical protein
MNTKAQILEHMFKKRDLTLEALLNTFNRETLLMLQQACAVLDYKTRAEATIVTSVHVKALILDDLRMIQKNLSSIKDAVKLKDLQIETMCLN